MIVRLVDVLMLTPCLFDNDMVVISDSTNYCFGPMTLDYALARASCVACEVPLSCSFLKDQAFSGLSIEKKPDTRY